MRRSVAAPAVVVLLSAIAGAWLLQRGIDRSDNMYVRARVLQEVLDRVESSYVEEIDPRSLINSAVDGVIGRLGDPHSSFIEAADYENLRIRTEGEYAGVGLEVNQSDEYVTVVTAIPGGPSERVGIRAGDQFYEIDGVAADTLLTDQAVALLRGAPGTRVTVKMLRPGMDDPIEFSIQREVIHLMAVPFSLMLEDDIGYVPLRAVQEGSSDEIATALDGLEADGMRALILDLRGNPGGLLDEGIGVSDLFLEPGQAIVETRGRARGQDGTYEASRPDRYPELPIVVLVDGASASAAEIIAGALQDYDRAVVVGETTYGKGSVQSLFPLTGGDVLRLTTARWYTPLGRSIHLDRTGHTVDLDNVLTAISGQVVERPSFDGRPVYATPSGRTVYGGGGIPPDLFVSPETLSPVEVQGARRLFMSAGAFSQAIFNGAVSYVQTHPDVEPGFTLSDDDLDAFFDELADLDTEVSREDLEAARRYVSYHLEREIAVQEWGQAGQFRQSLPHDHQVERAMALLDGVTTPAQLLEALSRAEADAT